jgi:hypothetical protein
MTVAELQRKGRCLHWQQRDAEHVLSGMSSGDQLHLHYQNGRPIWILPSGTAVGRCCCDRHREKLRRSGRGRALSRHARPNVEIRRCLISPRCRW